MNSRNTEVCDICEKEISIQSIQLHKIHCERNTIKCQECQTKLNRSELETHFNEFHTKKTCEKCSAEIESRIFDLHQCPKAPVKCDYCHATFPRDLFAPHAEACGARTEKCDRCRQYIQKRNLEQHLLDNSCIDYNILPNNRPRNNLKSDKELLEEAMTYSRPPEKAKAIYEEVPNIGRPNIIRSGPSGNNK